MWRLWTVFGLLVTIFVLITLRLFYWQVLSSQALRIAATSQYESEIPLPGERGSIYAADGSPLVINQPAYLVYAQPQLIEFPESFVTNVSEILTDIDTEGLEGSLKEPGRVWVPIAHKVEHDVAQKLLSLNLEGLGLVDEPKRYYPEASMAAHLLGFVGSDESGTDTGYFGVEGYYNRDLKGKEGVLRGERDAKGNAILIGNAKRVEPQDGRSLTLWADRTVQRIVERKLLDGIQKYGAKEGSVIVIDPKTGGVLALAVYPGFNPSDYAKEDNTKFTNQAVSGSFEPGSTFKVLVMSAALNEKLVTAETTMEEKGSIQIGEYTIRTWNDEYHGTISMTKVLEYSSNVGMAFIGEKLGLDRLYQYIQLFGVGEPTHIDVEEEVPSLRNKDEWSAIDVATATFGQGIAVTPLQMVRAVGALANDGWLMQPSVVKEFTDSRGRVTKIKPKRVRQVVSGATANIITEMMVAAVDNGEAKWAKPKGYRIAGKTGTAQIPVAGHYDKDKTIASFVGFAPADNPRFVMLVTLREPTSSPWGSETAAPLFFSISRDLFTYWGIPPL